MAAMCGTLGAGLALLFIGSDARRPASPSTSAPRPGRAADDLLLLLLSHFAGPAGFQARPARPELRPAGRVSPGPGFAESGLAAQSQPCPGPRTDVVRPSANGCRATQERSGDPGPGQLRSMPGTGCRAAAAGQTAAAQLDEAERLLAPDRRSKPGRGACCAYWRAVAVPASPQDRRRGPRPGDRPAGPRSTMRQQPRTAGDSVPGLAAGPDAASGNEAPRRRADAGPAGPQAGSHRRRRTPAGCQGRRRRCLGPQTAALQRA